MTSKMNLNFLDYSGESSSVQFRAADIVIGNIVAVEAALDNLASKVEGVSIGNLRKDTRILSETKFSVSPPSNQFAQRETKWLVRMVDTNGNGVTAEIPCADLGLLSAGSDKMNLASGAGQDLVDAIEGTVLSNDGEAVVVVEIVVVGRTG